MITIPHDEFTNDLLPAEWIHIRTTDTEVIIFEPGDTPPQPEPAPPPDEPAP